MKELGKIAAEMRAVALGYPETYEEQPWGHRVVKCAGKMFFTCDVHDGELSATVKLPRSGKKVLERKYAEPTHYGMGKYGWVTVRFKSAKEVPVDEMRAWIEETFVSMAPKKLIAARGKAPSAASAKAPSKTKKPAPKKITARAVLVCADELRSKRAVEEYAARGVGLDVVATTAKLKLGKTRALVIDIGRNPVDGIALAKKIDGSDAAVHLFVAGVRDADQTRQLRALGSAECFRAPAGDAKVADAVAAALTKPRR
ncbi:MAG TPA: MmcQ/YjbR family DNA-binding protein [Polyangia bacterium]|nr:MmcQ/YjbR family DNA-binding protein [Polyangia bacterium]